MIAKRQAISTIASKFNGNPETVRNSKFFLKVFSTWSARLIGTSCGNKVPAPSSQSLNAVKRNILSQPGQAIQILSRDRGSPNQAKCPKNERFSVNYETGEGSSTLHPFQFTQVKPTTPATLNVDEILSPSVVSMLMLKWVQSTTSIVRLPHLDKA
jgi:hypothetical protein